MRLGRSRVLVIVLVSIVAAVLGAFAAVVPAPDGRSSGPAKVVELICMPGWRAGAGGQYGGVGFDVTCSNGRGRARLVGTSGTGYSVRMGVESSSGAADCFFSGDEEIVDRTCAAVRLSIR